MMVFTQRAPADGTNSVMITISVMLATIMQTLDTTIANVALPHMKGVMGTTQDQISWVLTSYIVAAAICMPLTGFLASRIGRKRLFMGSVIGFTLASSLCGAAQSLDQIVLFRILQGIFGASLVPLSQSVLLDTYPKEKHGQAMAIWGVGVMVGPILGPYLGGLLTEYYSWRWVFYINVPFGIIAWLGIAGFVRETTFSKSRRFDLYGFVLLGIAIGSLQMMLDRGESQNWFNSIEVVIEAFLAVMASYLFLVHIFTHSTPFIDPQMFSDRNFSIGMIFIFIVGVILLSSMTLLTPFMENLMGYPVVDVGTILAPRGFGTMVAMLLVGKLSGKVDSRYFIILGLLLITLSLWEMTLFNLNITAWDIIRTGLVQGAGLGFIFTSLSAITFATLHPKYRDEGTSMFSLLRNIGSSMGISVVTTYLAQRTQINHSAFADYITPFNLGLQISQQSGGYSISSVADLSVLNQSLNAQAATLAYLQDFRLMMWITIAALPLVILLKAPRKVKKI